MSVRQQPGGRAGGRVAPARHWLAGGAGIALVLGCAAAAVTDTPSSRPPSDRRGAPGASGPTVLLGYDAAHSPTNPIAAFMYFVPLITPTRVTRTISAGNRQQVRLLTYARNITADGFQMECEFEMAGRGFLEDTFDADEMLASRAAATKKNAPLRAVLDHIRFEGEGIGGIEARGMIAGATQTVTEVVLRFNARGHPSPMTIGLYDVAPQEGRYAYANRSNVMVARVNELVFRRSDQPPRIGMRLASLRQAGDAEGFFSHLKGSLANLFINPTRVDPRGHASMLAFGLALLQQQPSFTFPKAGNLTEQQAVPAAPASK